MTLMVPNFEFATVGQVVPVERVAQALVVGKTSMAESLKMAEQRDTWVPTGDFRPLGAVRK